MRSEEDPTAKGSTTRIHRKARVDARNNERQECVGVFSSTPQVSRRNPRYGDFLRELHTTVRLTRPTLAIVSCMHQQVKKQVWRLLESVTTPHTTVSGSRVIHVSAGNSPPPRPGYYVDDALSRESGSIVV